MSKYSPIWGQHALHTHTHMHAFVHTAVLSMMYLNAITIESHMQVRGETECGKYVKLKREFTSMFVFPSNICLVYRKWMKPWKAGRDEVRPVIRITKHYIISVWYFQGEIKINGKTIVSYEIKRGFFGAVFFSQGEISQQLLTNITYFLFGDPIHFLLKFNVYALMKFLARFTHATVRIENPKNKYTFGFACWILLGCVSSQKYIFRLISIYESGVIVADIFDYPCYIWVYVTIFVFSQCIPHSANKSLDSMEKW